MMKCSECGTETVYRVSICPKCGKDMGEVPVKKKTDDAMNDFFAKTEVKMKAKDCTKDENDTRKGIFTKILIGFLLFGVLTIAMSFNDGDYDSAAVAIVMTLLFLCAYLMETQAIKIKKNRIKMIVAVVAFALIIPYFAIYTPLSGLESEKEENEPIVVRDKAYSRENEVPEQEAENETDENDDASDEEETTPQVDGGKENDVAEDKTDTLVTASTEQKNEEEKAAVPTESQESAADAKVTAEPQEETSAVPKESQKKKVEENIVKNGSSVETTGTESAVESKKEPSKENKESVQSEEPAEAEKVSGEVYITPTGKKYHFEKSCAGKNAIASTMEDVAKRYQPCKKCAQD